MKVFFASLLLPLALSSPVENGQPEKRYAIMDNDWGTAQMATFLMALDGGMEILGLVSGELLDVCPCISADHPDTANTWQRQCAMRALSLLEAGNLSCIPVYEGATYPLINSEDRFKAWEAIHGKLPWEGAYAPLNKTAEAQGSDPTSGNPHRVVEAALKAGVPNTTVDSSTNAANFMVEMVHKYPGQVSIYSAGALTNVALAVRMDAQFASLAKELVIMGGYVDFNMLQATGTFLQADINSDVSTSASGKFRYVSANLYQINLMIDPEAAKIALTADFPNIIVAGNVANQVLSSQEFLDEVYQVKNTYTELFHKYYSAEFPFWDETASALMVDKSIITNSSTGKVLAVT